MIRQDFAVPTNCELPLGIDSSGKKNLWGSRGIKDTAPHEVSSSVDFYELWNPKLSASKNCCAAKCHS